MKESWKTTKIHLFKRLLLFLLFFIVMIAIAFISEGLILAPVFFLHNLPSSLSILLAALMATLLQISSFLLITFMKPLLIHLLIDTISFKTESSSLKAKPLPKKPKQPKFIKVIAFILVAGLFFINLLLFYGGEQGSSVAIIAHRGFMEEGVENSITALIASSKAGADMVELDIQETKDGKFAVIHDSNLKRLAGINKNVYDMTLDELEKVQIHQNSFTDTIPSLSSFIDVAKEEDIDLLIEIKPHGRESDQMIQNLLSLIKEKNFEDSCILQSLHLPSINKIKEIDSTLNTCYIIPFLVGDLPDTPHNFIALEDFSVTDKILAQINTKYEGLLIWTVNDETLIENYLSMEDVAALITNNVTTAVNLRNEMNDGVFE